MVISPGWRGLASGFLAASRRTVKPRYLAVSTGFFDTMQIHLLDGRDFTARDMAPGSTAVVVNQEFVRQYLPGENPLGQRFEKTGDDPQPVPQEIVGVVRDAKFNNLREANSPTVYGPWRYTGRYTGSANGRGSSRDSACFTPGDPSLQCRTAGQ